MKLQHLFLLMILVLYTVSCGSSSHASSTAPVDPHTQEHLNMHKEFKEEQQKKAIDTLHLPEKQRPNEAEMSRLRVMQDRYQKGIDFYALGNEPFWSLDIDYDKGLYFNTMGNETIEYPYVKPEINGDKKIFRTGNLVVEIEKKQCADTMSDEVFEYSVSVSNSGKPFKGCGNDVPDFGLHDIWAVVKINGLPVKRENYKKEMPRMEINISKGTVSGYDGCNRFTGKVKANSGYISFGPIAGTLMLCQNTPEFVSSISNGTFQYRKENGLLIIYKDILDILVLKHID